MNYLRLLFVLTGLVMISCSQNSRKKSSDKGFKIEIVNENEVYSPLELTDIFSKIELTPLETSKNAILGRPNKLIVWNNLFYIHNTQQNEVLVFDKNGSLIFSSKTYRGKGPNEHINCGNYTINRNTGNILIMDQLKSKIFEYNLKDGFVGHMNFPRSIIGINDFEILKDNIYLFYSSSGFKDHNEDKRNNTLLVFDSKSNKVIKGIAPSLDERIEVHTKTTSFYHLNDTIHFNYLFPSSHTYIIDPEQYILIEKYIYDFASLNLDLYKIPNSMDPKLHSKLMDDLYSRYAIIGNMLENDRFVFLSYFHKTSNIGIYDKINKSVSIKQNKSGSQEQLLPPDAIDDKCLYYLCLPEYINYVISQDLLTESAKNALNSIKESDNYVIIKYILKD